MAFLWWILVIVPMIGILELILYVILRESSGNKITKGKTSIDILKGEVCKKGEHKRAVPDDKWRAEKVISYLISL
ncbi:hypothetical protein L1994_02050 [Methanomicrobium antiquum]|jgi:hypothetical protein|uniref:Uncharacterized protein n=1 Tax=Methanomicrobium antiquum TaxID=487686 RepID=A0AAF0JN95_9EURY|nr:hypothetical protein [Methanomicrobium antiquum]MDD3952020.1 hypothetical protein [Desulfobacterales bacterium]WFN37196.1 hypothetical protein L1994_02050 [Methanomicrobium antiquum]